MTTISPTASAAGGKTWATLGAAKVTVRSATTCGPMGCAWLAARPLGRSTATTGTARSLITCTASANSPSRGRERPVPKSASTITSHSATASVAEGSASREAISRMGSSARRQMPSCTSASPESGLPPVTRKMRTSKPRTARWRATASPSPPLLPGPQKRATESASP